MPLSAGSRLGPYEIIALVGSGGMGEVYRAKDARLERLVAIKVLPHGGALSPQNLEVSSGKRERPQRSTTPTSAPSTTSAPIRRSSRWSCSKVRRSRSGSMAMVTSRAVDEIPKQVQNVRGDSSALHGTPGDVRTMILERQGNRITVKATVSAL
jgi:serine/threonine protein kinase